MILKYFKNPQGIIKHRRTKHTVVVRDCTASYCHLLNIPPLKKKEGMQKPKGFYQVLKSTGLPRFEKNNPPMVWSNHEKNLPPWNLMGRWKSIRKIECGVNDVPTVIGDPSLKRLHRYWQAFWIVPGNLPEINAVHAK